MSTRTVRRRRRTLAQTQGSGGGGSTFIEDFETGAFKTGWDAAVISGTGTQQIVQTGAINGTYSLKLNKPLNDNANYRRYPFTATNSVKIGGMYKWLSDSGGATTNGTGPRLFSGSNRIIDVARQDGTDKRIFLRYQSTDLVSANALFIQTGVTVELNTAVKLDMQVDYASGANSRVRVWVNDVLKIDASGLTLYSGSYTAMQVGSEHTAQYLDLIVDDVTLDTAPSGIPTPPPSTTNQIISSGQRLRYASDNTIFSGRGLNVQTKGFSFSQTTFNNWSNEGVKFIRLGFWPRGIETAAGVYDQTELNYIHTSIQRAAAATGGVIMVELCPLLNTPVWGTNGSEALARLPNHWLNSSTNPTGPATPVGEWSTASHFDVLCSHGQGYMQKLMTEFKDYANVVAMEPCTNEPDRASAGPIHRGINRMLGWVRAVEGTKGMLWFITNMYSSQKADTADNVWTAITDLTNCVLQLHSYFAPQLTNSNGWNADSVGLRNSGSGQYWNGSIEAATYSTVNKASFALHVASWKAKADELGLPWGVGETGVQHAKADQGQRVAWTTDITDAAEAAGASFLLGWIGADNLSQDAWSSSNAQIMRTEYLQFMTFTPTGGGAPVTLGHMLSGGVEATGAKVTAVGNVSAATMRAIASTSSSLTSPIYGTSVAMISGDATNGYAATSVITGLSADTAYYYGVELNGTINPARGQFRTAVAAGTAASFVFGVASCQRTNNTTNNTVWQTIRARTQAFFLHLGDLHYSDSPTWTTDAEARAAHNVALRQSGLAAYLAEKPWIYCYDDHDTGGNDTVASSAWRPIAQRVFRQWFPSHDLPVAGENPVYFTRQHGRVLFIVTDCRTGRSDLAATDNSSKTMLGSAQKTWFKDTLTAAASDSSVKLIVWASTLPWIGTSVNNFDGWGSYTTERTELASHITGLTLHNRMLIVSGDMHASAIDDGTNSAGGIRVFQSGPLNQANSTKGGPYSTFGPYTALEQQFGEVTVTDPGGASELTVALSVRNGTTGAAISGGAYSFTTSGVSGGGGGGTAVTHDFEVPASGTPITTANSGGTGRNAFNSVSATAGQTLVTDNAQWYWGSQSGKFAVGATAGQSYVAWTTHAGAAAVYGRAYLFLPATPVNYQPFFRPYSASTSRLQIGVQTNRTIRLLDSAAATVATSTNAIALTTWVRVEWMVNFSTGAWEIRYFATPTSTTATETLSGTAASFGGTATEYRFGLAGSFANQIGQQLDQIALDTAGWLGP